MRSTTHVSPASRAGAGGRAVSFIAIAALAIPFTLGAQGRLPDEATIIRVARQVTPAVVSVTDPGVGLGSGVIVRADGIIITNAHVVGTASRVEVGLADGRQIAGQVLGRDPTVDVAIVRVGLTGLPTAPLGNSDQLEVGQTAIAIGNPIGLDRTVTTGIISAINRSPRGFELGGLIQTDAAINPGNSGGPLLDSQGRVIGINTAVIRVESAEGLGFAIPINTARDIAEQFLTTGRVRRAFLGVVPIDVTPAMAAQMGLPVREGVIIYNVQEGSPAARAGLRNLDIVTRMNDTPITQAGDLRRVIRQVGAGGTVRIEVRRPPNGARSTVSVQLGETEIR